MQIPLETFLICVRENAERITGYQLGHDGSDGKSDCIGLIIGALGLAGFRWPGTHGTNWAARNAMATLEKIGSAGEIFPGMIVYKAKEQGEEGYALPDRYKSGHDKRDYYHTGIVTGINPLEITHCTGIPGGIRRDDKTGAWQWCGKLKYVDYQKAPLTGEAAPPGVARPKEGEPVRTPCIAIVRADNGKPVNLRAEPGRHSVILAKVPVGEEVTVRERENADWAAVTWRGISGCIKREYLDESRKDEPESAGEGKHAGENAADVSRMALENWAGILEKTAREMREMLEKE